MNDKPYVEPTQPNEPEALDRFLDDLVQDPVAPAPLENDLDPEIAQWARQIVIAEQSQQPQQAAEEQAQARVWARVLTNASTKSVEVPHAPRRPLLSFLNHSLWRVAAATLGILIVVTIGLYAWASQPAPVNAEAILDKARATTSSPAANGVQSFVLTETGWLMLDSTRAGAYAQLYPGLKAGDRIQSEIRRWYQAPNRWREESQLQTVSPDGTAVKHDTAINVSDGTGLWQFNPAENTVFINALDPAQNGQQALSLFGQDVANLNTLFEQASTCYDAKVTGKATIAGRATYVIDLGPTKCPSASVPEMNGRLVVWIDQETFFVLKQEQHRLADDQIFTMHEVTQIQYNVSIDPAEFTFTPPAGATVADYRPKPAPTTDQFQQQLAQLAKQVEFPIFAPTYLPSGLAPQQPRIDPMMSNLVEVSYFPTSEPDKDSMASVMKGVTIREQRATNDIVAQWTDGADPMMIGDYRGWLRRGVHNADGTGSDSAALVLRDGVLVSILSFEVAPEELVEIAASLETVPGSHAPLPNPTLTAEQLQPHPTPTPLPPLSYQILRPTWLPEQMTIREQRDGDTFTLGFDPHPNDAPHEVLTLREMPRAMVSPGGQPDPQTAHAQIGGYDVTIIKRGQSCITLEWDSADLHLTLTNAYDPPGQSRYTCDQLQKIVESIR